MKYLVLIFSLCVTGCSTYQTHLKTGCLWSCLDIERDRNMYGINHNPDDHSITARTYFTSNGSYQVIRSGSTITVNQVSSAKR